MYIYIYIYMESEKDESDDDDCIELDEVRKLYYKKIAYFKFVTCLQFNSYTCPILIPRRVA